MALALQLGFPEVPKSITNKNVKEIDASDIDEPYSIIDFIKIINISFDPDTLQKFYNNYILQWNIYKKNKQQNSYIDILDKYKEFLKNVIIHYTTLEEKKFLKTIDFNDPLDLDIVLGFYSKKIKELCLFYNQKRENAKFGILRNKLRGTPLGTERTIKELILSYIQNLEDSKMILDFQKISSKIEIEIEELYDTYPLYFDQTPNEKIYDNKDLDYGFNLFLKDNSSIIEEVFSDLSDELKELKEIDEVLNNKRKLTQKYISTDFYYLSTGSTSTEFISGKLFENNNTILNFLNKTYPTTQSTERSYLQNEVDRGFFKPSNVSFVIVDGITNSFQIKTENLSPNKLYFFPDPNLIGNELGILEFNIDDSFLKKNSTSGICKNQPTSNSFDTKYHGYTSKIDPNIKKYMDDIFNSGYIKTYVQDIFGNSYGLFKSGFEKHITNIDTQSIIYNVLFNGYQFFDTLYNEGYSFNYFIEDDTTFQQTLRTGLSTNTATFSSFEPDLTLQFGLFSPYYELIEPTESNISKRYRYLDGAFISKPDLSFFPDPISSDLSAFEYSSGPFYYSTLLDGGINLSTTRALLDPLYPSLSAVFIEYPKLSGFKAIDCGRFDNILDAFTIKDYKVYIPTNTNNTEVITQQSLSSLSNQILIKNKNTKTILPLFDTLKYLYLKYPIDVSIQLENKVNNIYSSSDSLFIETDNYLTILKIKYDNGVFVDPKTTVILLEHSTDNYNKISNMFKVSNKVYYTILDHQGYSYDDTLIIYPKIYEFDTINFKNRLVYTPLSYELSSFSVSGYCEKSDSPVITYSSKNNIYNISFLLKDQNNIPRLRSMDFDIADSVNIHKITTFDFTKLVNNNIFYNNIPNTLSLYLSSTPTSIIEDEIII